MAELHLTILHMQSRLRRWKRTGSGWQACCPCHEDREPSLSIGRKHDRIVLRCHAGCDTASVLDRLGLDWADLFDGDRPTGDRRQARPRSERLSSQPRPRDQQPSPDYGPLLKHLRQHPDRPGRLRQLARDLGVPAGSLEALGCVWLSRLDPAIRRLGHADIVAAGSCWAFPEHDGDGHVIGLARRYSDGRKRTAPGGRRGITHADDWTAAPGQVWCVEGASDAAALHGCGLAVLARPSNTGGSAQLALALSSVDPAQAIIVLGENDQKPSGAWPGRAGALKVAAELRSALPGRRILAALPPEGAKDVRAWLAGRSGAQAGQELLAGLRWLDDQGNSQECPRNPLYGNEGIPIGDCADTPSQLPPPPPACACRRGTSGHLQHLTDTQRYRQARYACDSWRCPVCRDRLAYQWSNHLGGCVEQAGTDGLTLATLEVTCEVFDASVRRALRRRGAEWAALETIPGHLLVLAALPAGVTLPEGFTACAVAAALRDLAHWAQKVRHGPEPFSAGRKKLRPVRTSAGWRLPPREEQPQWRQLASTDTQSPHAVLDVLRAEGVRPTMYRYHLTADDDPGGTSSLAWAVEWRADPDTAERIASRLREIDDVPAVRPVVMAGRAADPAEDIPW